MNGVVSIRGIARTWRGRPRPVGAADGVPDRDADTPRREERVVARPRRERESRAAADPTTAYFVQLLDQPRARGLKADHGLRRSWAEAYKDADKLGRPRLVRTADERA